MFSGIQHWPGLLEVTFTHGWDGISDLGTTNNTGRISEDYQELVRWKPAGKEYSGSTEKADGSSVRILAQKCQFPFCLDRVQAVSTERVFFKYKQ